LRKSTVVSIGMLAIALLIAACGGGQTPTPACFNAQGGVLVGADCTAPAGATIEPTATPVPDGGSGVATGVAEFIGAGCAGCHTLEGVPQAVGQVGPDLTRIGAKGAEYIRQSIVDPNAVIAQPCPSGECQENIMPGGFAGVLSAAEIDAIVELLSK
jgi:mono/diheme cytochrome c family protein